MPTSTTILSDRLASVLGSNRVERDPTKLSAYAVDELTPSAIAKPATAEETAEVVRFALKENLSIIPSGSRSKIQIGNTPARYDIALDMTALNQIANYDPGDLTVSIDAGCTLQTIAATLNPQNQFLPLPSAFGENATIAGTIASGVDSHLRQFFGTARDFLIGAEFIDGSGARCKSGGRVVKNVTGYDLHKLLIGSLGTLGIITRLNFRTFPALASGESQIENFCASFAHAKSALAFRDQIAKSPFTPDAVEILSPEAAHILSHSLARRAAKGSFTAPPLTPPPFLPNWNVLVAFHGTLELRARYQKALKELAQQEGTKLSDELAATAFNAIHNLREASRVPVIFKITQVPGKLTALFAALAEVSRIANIPQAIIARGLGIVYFALLPEDPLKHLDQLQLQAGLDAPAMTPIVASSYQDAYAKLAAASTATFAACAAESATAQIQFAPPPLKRQLNILGPDILGPARRDATAMRRLKSAFDPNNLFSPGRLL